MKIAQRMLGVEKSLIRQIFDMAPPGALNLGLGEPGMRTPSGICADAVAVVTNEPLGYTPHAGLEKLRHAIAGAMEYPVEAQNVCVTVGSQEGLSTTFFTLLGDGDEVLVPNPGFVAYPTLARLAGARPIPYPLAGENGFHTDPEALAALVTPRTRAIVLNAPSNPTGAIDSQQTLRAVAALAEAHDLVVISDEAYRDIYFGEHPPESIGRYSRRAVVLRTFSKSYAMTGWRLGWTVAPAELAHAISVFHGYSVTSTSTLTQRVALKVLAGRGWPEFLARRREDYRDRLRILVDAFRGTPYPLRVPEGSFYALLDIRPTGVDSLTAAKTLVTAFGVTTVPGVAFGAGGEGYLRLSFAGEPATLTAACPRILAGLEQLAGS